METDEYRDAIVSLQLVSELLPRVRASQYLWKWIVISMHNALQGFMVLALKGTDSLRVLTEKNARKWLEAYKRGDGSYPKPRMDLFPKLYDKVKSDAMMIYGISRKLEPSESQDESAARLIDLRNGFVHFTPKLLSLDITGLPIVIRDVAEIIEFLGFESKNVVWYEEIEEEQSRFLVRMIQNQASTLSESYGACPLAGADPI